MLAPLLVAAVAATAEPLAPDAAVAAYARLLEARYATQATAVPAEGIEFAIDSARFRLISGELRGMEPVADGRVTGVVFSGRGILTLDLPDSRELENFRRAAERPAATRLETEFTRLVLRDGGGLSQRLGARAGSGTFAPDPLARERQVVWLERRLLDVDACVTRTLVGDGREWALAELEARELGWLTVEFDPGRAEELQVTQWRPDALASEVWVSLDRQAERGPDGRPASALDRQFDLLDAKIQVDLRKPGKSSRAGISDIMPRRARFEVELQLRPLQPDARSLAFALDPWIEVKAVRDESGAELRFLRDHVGERSSGIDDDLYDDDLLVLLPEAIGAQERRFTFLYEAEIINYVSGRGWYPGEEDPLLDPHTAAIALTALPKHDLRSMGQLVESSDPKGSTFRRWLVETPVRMVTFAFAEKFEEKRIEHEGSPAVIAFAARGGGGAKVFNVAADVTNSWAFFAQRFGPGPAAPELFATSIVGWHGQAFEGFLHLSEATFELESRGPTELFRSHEVAHQWWGHLVAWKSYRDQWLSEGFAQFSAMLFVEAAVEKGPQLYDEIVESFSNAALGEAKVSRFQRYFTPPQNARQWRRVGPIALGYRASTADVPSGYQIQAYYKGALVLNMLRQLLRARTGNDELLMAVLADFAQAHRGSAASTADFQAALTRHARADWSWFFRQWVDGTEIPTYRWSWSAGKDEAGGPAILVDVDQTGVGADFRMPVPVAFELTGGERGSAVVVVHQPHERFTLAVPKPPKRVELNPGLAVLARMKRD